jgi:hypothetical protein
MTDQPASLAALSSEELDTAISLVYAKLATALEHAPELVPALQAQADAVTAEALRRCQPPTPPISLTEYAARRRESRGTT